jgi:hypothetical protein
MGICGGVFASAFMTATAGTNLNKAVFLSESAAEAFHAYDDIADFAAGIGGSTVSESKGVIVYYDKDWQPQAAPEGAQYTLLAQISEDGDLVSATIGVSRGSEPIFELTATKNAALRRSVR